MRVDYTHFGYRLPPRENIAATAKKKEQEATVSFEQMYQEEIQKGRSCTGATEGK